MSLWKVFVEYGVERYRKPHVYCDSQRIGEYIKKDTKMKKEVGVLVKPWGEWEAHKNTRDIWHGLKLTKRERMHTLQKNH